MGQTDEHEMLIEYSEMTSFDFNSEEFQKVKKDYLECKNFFSNFKWTILTLFDRVKFVKNY